MLLLEAGRQVAVGDFVDAGRPRMPASPSSRLTNHGAHRLLLVQGRSRLEQGDLEGAAEAFVAAADLAAPYDITIVLLIARSHLAEIHRRAGRA